MLVNRQMGAWLALRRRVAILNKFMGALFDIKHMQGYKIKEKRMIELFSDTEVPKEAVSSSDTQVRRDAGLRHHCERRVNVIQPPTDRSGPGVRISVARCPPNDLERRERRLHVDSKAGWRRRKGSSR